MPVLYATFNILQDPILSSRLHLTAGEGCVACGNIDHTYPTLQFRSIERFFIWWYGVFLLKIGADNTLLHQLKGIRSNLVRWEVEVCGSWLNNSILGEKKTIPSSKQLLVNNRLIKAINHYQNQLTSSRCFWSFSFFRPLETFFDLLPSKLMYKPPSSFTFRPGSILQDNSFLWEIVKQRKWEDLGGNLWIFETVCKWVKEREHFIKAKAYRKNNLG